VSPGFWTDANDYSASLQFKWNEQALYIAATVADDVLQLYPSDVSFVPRPNYDGMSVHLGLANPLDPNRTTYGPLDFHVLVQPWGPGPDTGNVLLTKVPQSNSRFLAISLALRWKRVSFGYTMEASIPWDALTTTGLPMAGQTIGFNVVGHDYDARAPLVDSEFSFTRLPGSDTDPRAWTTAVLQPPPAYFHGDFDGDGAVTVKDAAIALGTVGGLRAAGTPTAPGQGSVAQPVVPADGVVSLDAVVHILRQVSGLEEKWPG
jgi:hypothetical protein